MAPTATAHGGPHGPVGAITGSVLKLARLSAGLSQEALAELLGVSLDTVQGWESGRRPMPATRASALVDVRYELVTADANADLVAALDPAMQADWLIGQTLEPSARAHPLARLVTTRRVHDLLVWALVGRRPLWLPSPAANGLGRGPVPAGPALGAAERGAVFERLRDLAERTDGRQEAGLQLRRQAAYLAAIDPAPDTAAWLDQLPRAEAASRDGWSPAWVAARSRAITIASRGDPDPLRWFIDHALAGDDQLEGAQLAWNAHYYGELATPQHSEEFMVADLSAWHGDQLLRWLAGRLDPACGYVDLVTHTLWALLRSRHYLASSPAADGLADRVEALRGTAELSPRSRQELGEVGYLLRALAPTKGPR